MHNLAISHKVGRGSDIFDSSGLIAKLRVTDYVKGKSVNFSFTTLNPEGGVIDKRDYFLTGEMRIKPFSDLDGFKEHGDDLEIYVGLDHSYPGFNLVYYVEKCLDVVRTDAKKKNRRQA